MRLNLLAKAASMVMIGTSAQVLAQTRIDPDTGVGIEQFFEFPDIPPMKPFWGERLTGYVKARDGTMLRYSVLLPKGKGPHPVILSYNGYDAGSIGGISYRKYQTAMSVDLDRKLIEAGYAVMGLSPRGTGCSEGTFNGFGPPLGEDGAVAVEWAAKQSWSNGAVGMVNWSYGGASQLATAEQQPPHLRAIAPGMVLGDVLRDLSAPGGVPQPGFPNAWRSILKDYWKKVSVSAVAEGDEHCVAQIQKNIKGEDDNSVFRRFLQHPTIDAVSSTWNLADQAARIKVPVLTLESFQDQATTVRGGYFQERVDPNLIWQVQTNGDHDLFLAQRYHQILLRFFNHFVKGEANGFEKDPRTTIWMETGSPAKELGARQMSAQPRWTITRPGVGYSDVTAREFHLGKAGVLASHSQPGPADHFQYPAESSSVNDMEANAKWGPSPVDWRKTSLAYTSEILPADMMVYGPGSADLWLAGTAGDADVQVTITEVRPDGQEMYVQRGWLRVSQRALDPARTTALRPFHKQTTDSIMPMNDGAAVFARVEIQKMGHLFRQGSRVRMWIDTPSQTGGFSFAPYWQKQSLYVLHNDKYDSVLRLGVLRDVKAPAERAACGEVLMQPCRPDPFLER